MSERDEFEALKPCPFCGAGQTTIHVNKGTWNGSGYGEPVSVEVRHWCDEAKGQPSRLIARVGRDEASAIAAWNRRATPQQAVPALTDGCTEENCQRCRTPQELRTPDLRHAGIGSYPPDEPSASPPPETQIDVAPMYKALTESRLALLAVNSGASRKAIALIDAVLNAAPQPSQEPQRYQD